MGDENAIANASGLAIIVMVIVGVIAWYFGSRLYPNRKSQVLMGIGITAPIVWLLANLAISAAILQIYKLPSK